MNDAVTRMIDRRTNRAIRAILDCNDRIDSYIPAGLEQLDRERIVDELNEHADLLRQTVLDEINELASLAKDLLDSLLSDHVAINEDWLSMLEDMHRHLIRNGTGQHATADL